MFSISIPIYKITVEFHFQQYFWLINLCAWDKCIYHSGSTKSQVDLFTLFVVSIFQPGSSAVIYDTMGLLRCIVYCINSIYCLLNCSSIFSVSNSTTPGIIGIFFAHFVKCVKHQTCSQLYACFVTYKITGNSTAKHTKSKYNVSIISFSPCRDLHFISLKNIVHIAIGKGYQCNKKHILINMFHNLSYSSRVCSAHSFRTKPCYNYSLRNNVYHLQISIVRIL